MPGDKKFELGNYVEVKDRIKILYELYGQARLVTEEVTLTTEPDGKPRVMVKALAYRTPDDPHPGVGYSWLELPGKTPYTNGSELENAETSAWGRAIASLGILIDGSIASEQEVKNKEGDAPATPRPDVETESLIGDLKRAGTVKRREAKVPIEAVQGPEGHAIVFRLEVASDKNIPQVVVAGAPGEALYLASSMKPDELVGERITVKGRLFNVTRPGKSSYYRLHVSEWETEDYRYPAEPVEAPSEPLPFTPEEQAAIVAQELEEATA